MSTAASGSRCPRRGGRSFLAQLRLSRDHEQPPCLGRLSATAHSAAARGAESLRSSPCFVTVGDTLCFWDSSPKPSAPSRSGPRFSSSPSAQRPKVSSPGRAAPFHFPGQVAVSEKGGGRRSSVSPRGRARGPRRLGCCRRGAEDRQPGARSQTALRDGAEGSGPRDGRAAGAGVWRGGLCDVPSGICSSADSYAFNLLLGQKISP